MEPSVKQAMEAEKLQRFVELTGSRDAQLSRHFLEQFAWDVQRAAQSFLVSSHAKTTAAAAAAPVQKKTGVAGFGSSLQQPQKSSEHNNYFSGGHSSGIAVMGGPDSNNNNDGKHVVDALSENAKRSGAVVEQRAPQLPNKFGGAGIALETGARVEAAPQPEQQVVRVLTMYDDGFTVDQGPFRPFSDPANKAFLDEVGRGEIPTELEQSANGRELHVDLVDKRGQKYVPPKAEKPKVQAFTGHGQSLSAGPSNSNNSAPAPVVVNAAAMRPVDETKETTQIQIRTKGKQSFPPPISSHSNSSFLLDGKRIVGKFNMDHTVGDIIAYVQANGAQGQLMSVMPRKVFGAADVNVTIAAANLKGASLMLQ